jgi:hypothetical protein
MIMKYLKWLIGIVAGAAIGFSYWYFIGCTTGSCAITSSPINSSIYGALMGILLISAFSGKGKENTENRSSL